MDMLIAILVFSFLISFPTKQCHVLGVDRTDVLNYKHKCGAVNGVQFRGNVYAMVA